MKIPTVRFQKSFIFLLSILSLQAVLAQTVFVGFKSTGWKFRTSNQEPATFGNGTWKTNAYNDAAWASGQATLGYDDGAPSHTINTWVWPLNANRNGNNSSKTHYFRKTFNVTNPADFSGYRIKTWCDDGLVVYLNNKEVYRLNMPAGTVDSLTSASMAPANDSIYGETTIYLPNDLLTGTNVIAVEVHQSGTSLDRYFDLSLEGILSAACSEWPVTFKSPNWKYRTSNQEPASFGNGTWKTNAYSDAAWASGQATLGYDDGTPSHTINTWVWPLNANRNGNNSSKTHYFRKCFNVTNPANFSGYRIKTWCDDGLVVYLNNKEVYRLNMPAGTVDSLTSASMAPANDSIYGETTIYLPNDLLTGTNVIAVEVHQSGTSLDRYFDLSIEGISGGCSVTLTRQPYLQLSTPTSMTVRWRTSAAIVGRVRYGTTLGNLTQFADDPAATTEHSITLTGLTPNQLYYYSVGCTENTVLQGNADNYFKTPPTGTERSLRFWLFGDSGKSTFTNRQAQTKQAYLNYLGNNYVDGVLVLGDIALREYHPAPGYEFGDGTDQILQQKFFNQVGDVLKKFPSWTTFGNHDYRGFPTPGGAPGDSSIAYHLTDAAIFQSFSFPSSTAGGINSDKNYYSFDVGNIHFVQVNPYYIPSGVYQGPSLATHGDTVSGEQILWLKNDLATTQKLWKIVFLHIPPYSKVKHNSDTDNLLINVREKLVPILERYKVDLVIAGHAHGLQRSKLINGVTATGTPPPAKFIQSQSARYPASAPYTKKSGEIGTVYIVNSDGGQGPDDALPDAPHPVMYYSDLGTPLGGSSELRVFKNRLDFIGIKQDGSKPDSFTLMKDVNKKTTYNNPTFPLTLTASWEGKYTWKILGQGSIPGTTQTLSVSPNSNTTYIVNDGYNGGNGFLADTFIVNVCAPTLTLNTTISTGAVYQASEWIKGTNTNIIAPSATVEYRAGYIELKPSGNGTAFLATPSAGHYFLAVPGGCNPGSGNNGNTPQGLDRSGTAILPSSVDSLKRQPKTANPRK